MRKKLRVKRFNSKENAQSFAKKVNGTFKDISDQPQSLSKYKVVYVPMAPKLDLSNDWAPEEDRDFGYPNSYWKD